MHVHESCLRREHKFYTKFYPTEHHEELLDILKHQIINKGFTRGGAKFTVPGSRASGDMNTALGNCILMIGMLGSFFRKNDIQYQIFDDGDDCLLYVYTSDYDKVKEMIIPHFKRFCHDLKIEDDGTDINDVIFCQARIMETPFGPKMVRLMDRFFSRQFCGGANMRIRPASYLATIGLATMIMNRAVPVYWCFGAFMYRLGIEKGGKFQEDLLEYNMKFVTPGMNYSYVEPTHGARVQYLRLFGLSVGEQISLEGLLMSSQIELTKLPVDIPVDLLLGLRNSTNDVSTASKEQADTRNSLQKIYNQYAERKKTTQENTKRIKRSYYFTEDRGQRSEEGRKDA
jgi:hypothetical protein